MSTTAINRTLLGYEPIVDRSRKAIAMRVTARCSRGGESDVVDLYQEMCRLWPHTSIPVLLRTDLSELPDGLLQVKPQRHIWLEVPAKQTGTQGGLDRIGNMHRCGFVQVLGGRPLTVLPPNLLPALRMSIIHVAEDRRLKEGARSQVERGRKVVYAQSGVESISQLRRSFETGAVACIGWPFADALQHATPSDSSPDFTTITQLLSMIERDADPNDLERVFRRDAALAYRLLRYINSAAFGLRVEVQSFRHAVMMLGYQRLKRWLLLMLTTASKDANMQPVMFASFRRGLFMEQLIGGASSPQHDEVFILGVLSLLDKLFREPLAELIEKLALPDGIRSALIERSGPYAAYLGVAEAVEHEPGDELARSLDDALISIEHCNRSLLKAVTVREAVPV